MRTHRQLACPGEIALVGSRLRVRIDQRRPIGSGTSPLSSSAILRVARALYARGMLSGDEIDRLLAEGQIGGAFPLN